MRILAGQDEDFSGHLQLSSGIKVGYLQQEPKLDMEATVLGNIEPALASTKSMLSEFEEVSLTQSCCFFTAVDNMLQALKLHMGLSSQCALRFCPDVMESM